MCHAANRMHQASMSARAALNQPLLWQTANRMFAYCDEMTWFTLHRENQCWKTVKVLNLNAETELLCQMMLVQVCRYRSAFSGAILCQHLPIFISEAVFENKLNAFLVFFDPINIMFDLENKYCPR